MDNNQLFLAIFSVLGMFCSQSRAGSPLLKYACLLGLISQPFWFYASIQAQQWGVFTVNIAATLCWLKGLWIFWIQPYRQRRVSPLREIVQITDIKGPP